MPTCEIGAIMQEAPCAWKEDRDTGCWDTTCNNLFYIEYERPSVNGMKFCCFCGRTILEEPYREELE